jgi:glycosyltransferase involved in cell wall biosynthesis
MLRFHSVDVFRLVELTKFQYFPSAKPSRLEKVRFSQSENKMSQVSIVVPIFNEFENVDLMYQQLVMAMKNQDRSYEILFVDDGSGDGTCDCLEEIAKIDKRVKLVLLNRNFGQTAAMMAGIQNAHGKLIITIDGDLQNDPDDIPVMLNKLEEGYDLVHGWRKHRKDKTVSRKIPSKIANWLISKVTRFPIHDLGCTLKAMRADVAKKLELYGEMHRFIPILANHMGARCVEVETRHRQRLYGKSKYGIDRTARVILDLITVKFITDYQSSPMKMLGKLALVAGVLSAGCLSMAMLGAMFSGSSFFNSPFLIFSAISMAACVQMLAIGLIGEACTRIYYSAGDKKSYHVRDLVNFETKDSSEGSDEDRPQFPRIAA